MAEYFVSALVGLDANNGTTFNTPKKTIQAAINLAVNAGDIVTIRRGTYKEKVKCSHAGANLNPIIIRNYNRDKVIVDGIDRARVDDPFNPTVCEAQFLLDADYIEVRGIIVRNSPGIGFGDTKWHYYSDITKQRKYCVFKDCLAHDNYLSGFWIDGVEHKFYRCESHHNFDFDQKKTGTNTGNGQCGGDCDGFGIGGNGHYFEECKSHHNADDGFDTYMGRDNTFVKCRAYFNGLPDGCRARSKTGLSVVDGTTAISAVTFVGDGCGFKMGAGGKNNSMDDRVEITYDGNADTITTTTTCPFVEDQAIQLFTLSGAKPTGISTNSTVYYVKNLLVNTFQVSTTPGGSAVTFTGNGSGTNYANARTHFFQANNTIVNCLAYYNQFAGFTNNNGGGNNFLHCTAYMNKRGNAGYQSGNATTRQFWNFDSSENIGTKNNNYKNCLAINGISHPDGAINLGTDTNVPPYPTRTITTNAWQLVSHVGAAWESTNFVSLNIYSKNFAKIKDTSELYNSGTDVGYGVKIGADV